MTEKSFDEMDYAAQTEELSKLEREVEHERLVTMRVLLRLARGTQGSSLGTLRHAEAYALVAGTLTGRTNVEKS